MRIVHPRAARILIFVAATALASCASPAHDPDEKYVFIAAGIKQPFWQEARAGFMDAASTLGVKVEVAGPDTLSPKDELTTFQNAVMMHPTGILLSAADPDLFKSEINSAITQQIPVICIDTDVPDSQRLLYIGTDNFRAGGESARRMAAVLKGQGNVLIVGDSGEFNVNERVRGATQALANYRGIKISDALDGKGDSRAASDQVVAVLESKKKIDGIIALDTTASEGAADALHRLNRDGEIQIVAFGEDPETLDRISHGTIAATIAQKPYIMTYYGLKFLDDLHHAVVHQSGNWHVAPALPLPTWVDTGTTVVDKNNLGVVLNARAAYQAPK